MLVKVWGSGGFIYFIAGGVEIGFGEFLGFFFKIISVLILGFSRVIFWFSFWRNIFSRVRGEVFEVSIVLFLVV